MVSRLALLSEILRTRRSKILAGLFAFMAFYQFACDQFGAPTLPNLFGMTGAAALPWWAWLLLMPLGLFYGLFEYVRRAGLPTKDELDEAQPSAELLGLTARIEELERAQPEPLISREEFEAVQNRLLSVEGQLNAFVQDVIKPMFEAAAAADKAKALENLRLPEPLKPVPRSGYEACAGNPPSADWLSVMRGGEAAFTSARHYIAPELLQAEIEKEQQAVRNNPLKTGLQIDDKYYWASSEEKMRWHLENAKRKAIQTMVQREIEALKQIRCDPAHQLLVIKHFFERPA